MTIKDLLKDWRKTWLLPVLVSIVALAGIVGALAIMKVIF